MIGMELVGDITSDGSNVGTSPPSLVPRTALNHTFTATREGNNLMYSTAATTGGEGDGGTLAEGLFGSVNVEPRGAEWYRSEVTAVEMAKATTGTAGATATTTTGATGGQPIIDYDKFKMLDAENNIILGLECHHHWSWQGTVSERNLQAQRHRTRSQPAVP